ncbi:hypothetical protein D3C76_1672380 [compost metagenome]
MASAKEAVLTRPTLETTRNNGTKMEIRLPPNRMAMSRDVPPTAAATRPVMSKRVSDTLPANLPAI